MDRRLESLPISELILHPLPFRLSLAAFVLGLCIPMVLRKKNAVEDFRKIIGNTNPEKAEKGTLRQLYGTTIRRNIVHGSDCEENALRELTFFFSFVGVIH